MFRKIRTGVNNIFGRFTRRRRRTVKRRRKGVKSIEQSIKDLNKCLQRCSYDDPEAAEHFMLNNKYFQEQI